MVPPANKFAKPVCCRRGKILVLPASRFDVELPLSIGLVTYEIHDSPAARGCRPLTGSRGPRRGGNERRRKAEVEGYTRQLQSRRIVSRRPWPTRHFWRAAAESGQNHRAHR